MADEEFAAEGGIEACQGGDEVGLAYGPGLPPKIRVENEQGHDLAVTRGAGLDDSREEAGIVEEAKVTAKPEDTRHETRLRPGRGDARREHLNHD